MLTSCAANSKVKYYIQFNSNWDILKRYNKITLYYLSSSRPGSAKKEQGEKSSVVSHNNNKQYLLFYFHRLVYIILQTVPDCNAYAQIDLLSPQGKNRPKEQDSYSTQCKFYRFGSYDPRIACAFIEVSAVYRFCYKPEPHSFKILYDNVYIFDNGSVFWR